MPKGAHAYKGNMSGIQKGVIVNIPTELSSEEKLEWSSLMSGLSRVNTESIHSVSLQEWSEKNIQNERVRLLFHGMCRQWSYCHDMRIVSAGYVIKQGKLAGNGVRYIEGGWQTIVDDLRIEAIKHGAHIVTNRPVEQVILRDGQVRAIKLANLKEVKISAVISAIGIDDTYKLIEGAEHISLGKWKAQSYPLYAACLDVALKQIPFPERVFAIGLDEPYYFSRHSGPVKLSNNGAFVFHVMRYNDNQNDRDASQDEEELQKLLDLLEPGWRNNVSAIRFSPNVLVAHDARTIAQGGKGITDSPVVPEIDGLFVAGDWVGQEGRLADAAMISAKMAALRLIKT
ncbi:NAD(P)/FAD-dependent oxidoreductase [Geomicrobium sp. JCM 19055]|uniref:phytoene desaturase family protein n=1 Tax=Geomicrobium sp. JCM 19055 TaxID=1460649 RepID=UPI000A47BEA1|nr:NAD(P)/FAD-dependent oxidoreductase [Geomicrobium sp. JCM 19055]